MNVLFFCHADFASNSMGHIAGFAGGLSALGCPCAAAIPGDDRTSYGALGENSPLRPFLFSETWERVGTLFPDGRPADIIHAWTPREHVRRAVERCQQEMPEARLVVHLEDNELHLTARFLGETTARLRDLTEEDLAARLPVQLSHPREAARFLGLAAGVTGIVGPLAEFAPRGVPFAEIRPGVDFSRFHPGAADGTLRESLGIRQEEKILVYPGSSHFANAGEMGNLYGAVFRLNREGVPCRLIRTGYDDPAFRERFTAADLATFVLNLGFVDRARVPDLLRLADALVQPGEADDFNRYRLPSKLPEFLATGRPVLLPRANVGLRVRPDREGIVLKTGTAEEIAAQCRRVFADEGLARRLSAGGTAFARRYFDRAAGARRLARLYGQVCSPRQSAWWRVLAACGLRS